MGPHQILRLANRLGIKGLFIKSSLKRKELRAYMIPHNGIYWVITISALTCDHENPTFEMKSPRIKSCKLAYPEQANRARAIPSDDLPR